MLVRNAHSDLRIVFESFVTLNLNTTEAYLLCLTKLTTTAGLKGFLVYIYGPEDTQTLRALKKKRKKYRELFCFVLVFGFFFFFLGLCLYFSALVRFPGCFAVLWMLSKRFLRVEHIRLLSVETCLTSSLRTLWAKPTPFTPFGFQNSTAIFWLCLAESVDSVRGAAPLLTTRFLLSPSYLYSALCLFTHFIHKTVAHLLKQWIIFFNDKSISIPSSTQPSR